MSRPLFSTIFAGGLFVLLSIAGVRGLRGQEGVLAGPSDGAEVLARGPVHEAFAEPLNLQATDPIVVDQAPPQPVEELPPDVRPEGNNVQWIPGYWAFDEDRRDFIWVSGVWRDCPPGQRWVPGYWNQGDRGWYWTAGFWVSENAQEVNYLPEPPQTLDQGPTIQAPSDNYLWVPGVWRYLETRYVWRPGYWTVAQPDWMWVPAHYSSSPSGYVFVDGYWDYPLAQRGVLFAPVYYQQPIYRQANYFYTPSTVISTDLLSVHLFARPRYSHYYFGDYYAPRYREIGIEPWLMTPRIRGFYDPLYTYYAWSSRRSGRDWNAIVRDRYDFFSRNQEYRPAHTFAELQRQRFAPLRAGDTNIQNIIVQQNNLVTNFNQYVQNAQRNVQGRGDQGSTLRFARLADTDRRAFATEAKEIRNFQQRRSQIESTNRGGRNVEQGAGAGAGTTGGKAGGRALPLTNLPNVTAGQGGRGKGPNITANLPPSPEKSARSTVGVGGTPQMVGKPITDAAPDATNPLRNNLPDANRGRGESTYSRGGERRSVDQRFNTQPGSAKGLDKDAIDQGSRGRGRNTDRDAFRNPPANQSDSIGPRLGSPFRGAAPTNTGDARERGSDSSRSQGSNNRRDFGTQPQVDRQQKQNVPLQDGNRGRSRDTFYRGSDGNPPSDRRLDGGGANSDARNFVDPFQGRDSRSVPDVGRPGARNVEGNQLPNTRRLNSTNQDRQQITNQRSRQGNPLQLRGDASDGAPRGQLNRGGGAASSNARGADGARAVVPRSGRDVGRSVDGSSKAAQVQRDTRPQPTNDDRDRDRRSN